MRTRGIFRNLIKEFGRAKTKKTKTGDDDDDDIEVEKQSAEEQRNLPVGKLIDEEERVTGAVSWREYGRYAKAVGGWPAVLFLVSLETLKQLSLVGVSLVIGFWTGEAIESFKQEHYIVSPFYNQFDQS